jgi:hypothetical protein
MLRLEITDDDCEEGYAYIHRVPLDTGWTDIQVAVMLMYPTATSVNIVTEDEKTEVE